MYTLCSGLYTLSVPFEVYAAPYNADAVLVLDTVTDAVSGLSTDGVHVSDVQSVKR